MSSPVAVAVPAVLSQYSTRQFIYLRHTIHRFIYLFIYSDLLLVPKAKQPGIYDYVKWEYGK